MQPFESVEERIGNEFQPAEIHKSVQRRINLLEVVVIFRSNVDAQRDWPRRRCRCNARHYFRRLLFPHFYRAPNFPIAGFDLAWCRAIWWQKRRRKVTVFDSSEVFSALPNAVAYFVQIL